MFQQEEAPETVVINVFQDALTQWTKPPYVSKKEQLEKESNIFSYPSTIPGRVILCNIISASFGSFVMLIKECKRTKSMPAYTDGAMGELGGYTPTLEYASAQSDVEKLFFGGFFH